MPGGYIRTNCDSLDWGPPCFCAHTHTHIHTQVDAPMPGGYITTGCDGLDWGAPGSLAAMPAFAGSAQHTMPSLSISGVGANNANWPPHLQQQLSHQQVCVCVCVHMNVFATAFFLSVPPAATAVTPPSVCVCVCVCVQM